MGKLLPFRRRLKSLDEFRPRWRGGRKGGGWLSSEWEPYVRSMRLYPAAEIRIMIWIGLILGLLAFQALRFWSSGQEVAPSDAVIAVPADPYAEAERSRDILKEREATPAPALWVIDGDTFHYRGERIRIADIDTPELEGRCAYERALAARATDRMAALLAAGPFELHPAPDGRDEDRYGRKLRIVTRAGRSLGDVLVAERLARTWTGRREPWC